MTHKLSKLLTGFVTTFVLLASLAVTAPEASASTLRLSPASGSYNVGDTVEVELLLNSEGEEVNAVEINLSFPADKLEVIAPSIGESILGIYAAPPKFDNRAGTLRLIGGIPGGVTTSNGVITKIGLRAKAPGQASIQFTGTLQALLNDGRGTESLRATSGATFQITMPEGMGPVVTSDTHPDQTKWYSTNNIALNWDQQFPAAEGYSYLYTTDSNATLDDISEGSATSYNIADVKEGISYFFVKALRNGEWGPASRFVIRADFTPPSDFPIDIAPYARTKSTKPLFQFSTTDQYSGVERYELRLIPINIEGRTEAMPEGERFFSVDNPYVVPDELMYGSYQVVVRAYDRAGNIKEAVRRLEITTSPFWFVSQEGLALPFGRQITWRVLVPALASTILLLILLAVFFKNWYEHLRQRLVQEALPQAVRAQLEELRRYKSRYGKVLPVLALMLVTSFTWFGNATALDKSNQLITSYSVQVGENELFFVSGKAPSEQPVSLSLTTPKLPEAIILNTVADQRGDWLYRHSDTLPVGQYTLYVTSDSNSGEVERIDFVVSANQLHMGNWDLPYLTAYAITTLLLLGIILLLIAYIIVHAMLVRQHHKQIQAQVRHAEDAIKRGFYQLRKDIESELVLIKQAKLNNVASEEQTAKEKLIEEDLRYIEGMVQAEFKMIEDMIEKNQ